MSKLFTMKYGYDYSRAGWPKMIGEWRHHEKAAMIKKKKPNKSKPVEPKHELLFNKLTNYNGLCVHPGLNDPKFLPVLEAIDGGILKVECANTFATTKFKVFTGKIKELPLYTVFKFNPALFNYDRIVISEEYAIMQTNGREVLLYSIRRGHVILAKETKCCAIIAKETRLPLDLREWPTKQVRAYFRQKYNGFRRSPRNNIELGEDIRAARMVNHSPGRAQLLRIEKKKNRDRFIDKSFSYNE